MNAKLSPSPLAEAGPRVESRVATRLLRSVIIKSFLDVFFICLVVSLAAFSNFGPLLRGAIDVADQTRVAGWTYDPQAAGAELEVQLFIDGRFAAAQRAGEPRADLVRAGATINADHGFSFAVEPLHLAPGRHLAQVYVVRQPAGRHKMLLPLSEEPLSFQVDH